MSKSLSSICSPAVVVLSRAAAIVPITCNQDCLVAVGGLYTDISRCSAPRLWCSMFSKDISCCTLLYYIFSFDQDCTDIEQVELQVLLANCIQGIVGTVLCGFPVSIMSACRYANHLALENPSVLKLPQIMAGTYFSLKFSGVMYVSLGGCYRAEGLAFNQPEACLILVAQLVIESILLSL